MSSYDIAVIGGGSAGLVVAIGAAQLGARVALIERKALGGDCLYTGCVPSKTLIRSARFAADLRRAEEFGFAPAQLKFKDASFAAITDRVQRVIQTVGKRDEPERFRTMGIEVIFGKPRFLSSKELEIGVGEEATEAKHVVRARRFCIATGSHPAVPLIEGLKQTGFITNEEVFHLQKLPQSLIILGAGPTGLELGQSFARFGTQVTVVEMGERLLPREDEEVSALMEDLLRAERLTILLNTRAVAARGANGHKKVTVECQGQLQELHAEEILVATGRLPNIEGLNLEAAGVKYDKERIITNEYLRTSMPNIFAAGDVTGHFPFTHMAAYEAAVVVRNALFFWPLTQKADFRVVPWAVFTDPEVGRVGLTEREARGRFGDNEIRVYRSGFEENDRAHADGETNGFIKLICRGRKNEILGAHIVSTHAGELIHEIVLAMKHRLPATSLGSLIHVYPTRTQVNQRAGLEPIRARLTPFTRKVLAQYFSWRR
ncbi:MAG TPA: FAD-dependent oxidoreductase [Pyrinomonadaceae bacterium]|nr:FAD-dependent oxidoreductase [Pyrinomonadaceae bacterium]